MPRLTFRIDDDLDARLRKQARMSGLSIATYCRDVLNRYEGLDPGRYHARFDEVHATCIETFALLARSVGKNDRETLTEGLAEGQRLLLEKGLLEPVEDRA